MKFLTKIENSGIPVQPLLQQVKPANLIYLCKPVCLPDITKIDKITAKGSLKNVTHCFSAIDSLVTWFDSLQMTGTGCVHYIEMI